MDATALICLLLAVCCCSKFGSGVVYYRLCSTCADPEAITIMARYNGSTHLAIKGAASWPSCKNISTPNNAFSEEECFSLKITDKESNTYMINGSSKFFIKGPELDRKMPGIQLVSMPGGVKYAIEFCSKVGCHWEPEAVPTSQTTATWTDLSIEEPTSNENATDMNTTNIGPAPTSTERVPTEDTDDLVDSTSEESISWNTLISAPIFIILSCAIISCGPYVRNRNRAVCQTKIPDSYTAEYKASAEAVIFGNIKVEENIEKEASAPERRKANRTGAALIATEEVEIHYSIPEQPYALPSDFESQEDTIPI